MVKPILLISILLTTFGLLMVFESSFIYSNSVIGNKYIQQIIWVGIGIVMCTVIYKLNMASIKKLSFMGLLITFVALQILAIHSVFNFNSFISTERNGAHRWLDLVIVSLQPSDFAKLFLIIYFAVMLDKIKKSREYIRISVFFVVALAFVGLVAIEPDYGTAGIIFCIINIMYFASKLPLKYLIVFDVVLMTLGILFSITSPYRRERIVTFLHPSSASSLDAGYHINQVLIALGSGGFYGLGLGQSRQRYMYVPEVFSDSIFAIVGEELGFVGCFIVISLYMFLFWNLAELANISRNTFSKLCSVGFLAWFGFQTFLNLFSTSGLLPLTGVPLQFISYGGSSVIVSFMALGLLLKIAKDE